MITKNQEKYIFRNLSLIDMERALESIDKMEESKDEYIREALFRDAVVSYIRPFSDNKGENIKKGLKINKKGIPDILKNKHREIEEIRNKLFAHNDLSYQEAEFGPGTSFVVNGYDKVYLEHLIEPLKQLAAIALAHLREEMSELKKNGL